MPGGVAKVFCTIGRGIVVSVRSMSPGSFIVHWFAVAMSFKLRLPACNSLIHDSLFCWAFWWACCSIRCVITSCIASSNDNCSEGCALVMPTKKNRFPVSTSINPLLILPPCIISEITAALILGFAKMLSCLLRSIKPVLCLS